MDDEMTYAEAAKLLGVGVRRVRKLAAIYGWRRHRSLLDERMMLLQRADVERAKKTHRGMTA